MIMIRIKKGNEVVFHAPLRSLFSILELKYHLTFTRPFDMIVEMSDSKRQMRETVEIVDN